MNKALPVEQRLNRMVRVVLVLITILAVTTPLAAGASLVFNRIQYDTYTKAIERAVEMRLSMRWAQSDLRIFDRTREAEYSSSMSANLTEADRALDDIEGVLGGVHEFDDELRRTRTTQDQWQAKAGEIGRKLELRQPVDLETPIPLFDEFDRTASDLHDRLERKRADLVFAQDLTSVLLVVLTLAIAGATVIVVRREVRSTSGAIAAPIKHLDSVVGRQRSGETDARADTNEGPVEIRNLATALNDLFDEERRTRETQEERNRVQAMTIRCGEHLRTFATLPDAARLLSQSIGRGLGGQACLVRFRAITEAEISHLWVDPDGGLAGAGRTEFEDLLPASRAQTVITGVADQRSFLVVPVRIGDDTLGAITVVRSRTTAGWTDFEIEMVEQVAATLARVIFTRTASINQTRHLAQLRELDHQKDAFISTVSHELRTPLASISGYTEMLGDGDAGELTRPQKSMVGVIERNARRLTGLVEDLLILNRIESSNLKVARHEVDLTAITREVVEDFQPLAADKSIELIAHDDGPTFVEGDSDHLHRALSNLVSNAIKFTPAHGHVTVSVSDDADRVRVEVTDDGMGIPGVQLSRVTDRFFRASNAQIAEVQGTGLGLSIVNAIVEGHRGQLDITSVENEGSTFRITLPALHRAE